VTFENIETTTNNSIIMYVIASDYDSSSQKASISDANNLSRLYYVVEYGTSSGTGGSLSVYVGEMKTKGNTGQVAFTLTYSSTCQTYACVFESVDEIQGASEEYSYWS
jgi:hypothetical protein